MSEAYPLKWPAGWPRAKSRKGAAFKSTGENQYGYNTSKPVTVAIARERLSNELDRLGARYVTLSSNLELRLDGQPRSGGPEPQDPGAAVYFQLGGKDTVLACDKWDRVADNIVALAKHIDAMRGMERWGVGTAAQAFAGYQALPAPDPWWKVLGFDNPPTRFADVDKAYRYRAKHAHPDRPGGSHDQMARLNEARDEALRIIAVHTK